MVFSNVVDLGGAAAMGVLVETVVRSVPGRIDVVLFARCRHAFIFMMIQQRLA